MYCSIVHSFLLLAGDVIQVGNWGGSIWLHTCRKIGIFCQTLNKDVNTPHTEHSMDVLYAYNTVYSLCPFKYMELCATKVYKLYHPLVKVWCFCLCLCK